jgi:predicted DNA binding CopG/RHH family protein
MKIPVFKNEDEEADWLYAHRKQIERELRTLEKSGKGLTVQEILAEQSKTQAISLRLPVADIERAKQRATAKGIGYQTLIRMLLHEALHR